MNLQRALRKGRNLLRYHEIEEYALDARLLLEYVTGLSHGDLLMKMTEELPPVQLHRYRLLLEERANHRPLQHIIGNTSFMGLEIRCDGRALIPRQETELLAERAIRLSVRRAGLSVLDLCTGSGCIAAALACLGQFQSVTASDLSEEALSLARENFECCGVEVECVQGDLFAPLPGRRFDVIVSNPPYIEEQELKELMPEVRDHDPRMALDGGPDGLVFYRRIAAEAPAHLNPDGRLLLEIGDRQAEAVCALLAAAGFESIRVIQDYGGRDRIISAVGGMEDV